MTASTVAKASWEDLEGTVWRTDMDQKLQNKLELMGGTGMRPAIPDPFAAGRTRVANVILMQFTVSPIDVETKLARVRFDVTRSIQAQGWHTTFDNATPVPTPGTDEDWPTLLEEPNDDMESNDESDKVNQAGHLYVMDIPSIWATHPATVPNKIWVKQNFVEFVRVSFNGARPNGESVEGSAASPYYGWHSEATMIWDTFLLAWRRTSPAEMEHNSLDTGHITIGETP